MDFEDVQRVNAEITSLRARGFLKESIQLVRATVPNVADQDYGVILLEQGLLAAQALGDEAETRSFASAILALDPGVPSAKRALGLS